MIADAEYSPGEITAWRQVCLEIHAAQEEEEDMENEIHSANVKMMRIHPHPSRVQTKPKIYNPEILSRKDTLTVNTHQI